MAKQNRAERQARLAVPAPEAPTVKPLTRDELYAEAKRLGIKGASKFTRDQLATAVNDALADGKLTPADRPVVNTPDISTIEGRRALANDRIAAGAEHYQEVMADPNAPKPEEDLAKRTIKAKAEQKALKAWQFGGMQGDRPVTPNYDAVCAVYAGVAKAPGSKAARRSGGAKRESAKPGGPRGDAAAAAKDACGGKRASTVKISDDDLRAYIVRVHQEHPESARQDEREYAFWVERLNLSGRFPRFWKELVTDADQDLDTEAGTDLPPADYDAGESPEAVKAALEHALRPKATVAEASKPKRGDNLRSKKTTAAKATPAKAAPKKTGARKEVTPIPKSTPRKRAGTRK